MGGDGFSGPVYKPRAWRRQGLWSATPRTTLQDDRPAASRPEPTLKLVGQNIPSVQEEARHDAGGPDQPRSASNPVTISGDTRGHRGRPRAMRQNLRGAKQPGFPGIFEKEEGALKRGAGDRSGNKRPACKIHPLLPYPSLCHRSFWKSRPDNPLFLNACVCLPRDTGPGPEQVTP
jgi:hypothetical protein